MSDEFQVEKSNQPLPEENGQKVIDEANYNIRAPRQYGPAAIGRGGDPLFRNILATKEQLVNLLDETATVQDWVQKETCNNVALACLNNENLKDIYYKIKDGFDDYGPILLMGYKTPQGVEIPRLKILSSNGEDVLEVLSGPFAIEELNKRALAYQESTLGYEAIVAPAEENVEAVAIQDYSGNPDDYA